MVTFLSLVSLEKTDDEVETWLEELGHWEQISAEVEEANRHPIPTGRNTEKRLIPLETETDLREQLKIDEECIALLRKLLDDSNGIPLRNFGIHPSQWDNVLRQQDCACARLVNLGLARAQDDTLLKATKIAFDKRAQFLVGFTQTH